jgi:Ca2+-transporting ATPase
MTRWWRLDLPALAGNLKTDLTAGLSSEEARRRLEASGPNKLAEGKGRTSLGIFLEQFADFMIWVLIGAALVSGFLKEWVDAAAIVAIVVLNAVLGFIQEHRAERSLQALRRMASPTAKAVRDGAKLALPAGELVAGDVIELEAGDHVPADSRVISHTANFAVQEAGLTGESTPVLKTQAALEEDDLPLGDRTNMIYMGTAVVAGKARAVVVETGMQTELGKIAGMIQDIGREQTPLQKRLEQFGKFIILACFVLVGLVFVMGLLRGGKLLEMFLTSVSLAVAAIPEGMPAVVTIALALGVQRMVRRHVLIRKLPAVETLGCVTVICSDKTGTLTKNEMTVRAVVTVRTSYQVGGAGYEPKGEFEVDGRTIVPADDPDLTAVLRAAVLCNGAELAEAEGRFKIVGDPTEGALLVCAAKAGLLKTRLESEAPFLDEIPFDSERKRMTILRRSDAGVTAFVKGAPDVLLERCTAVLENGRERPLGKGDAAEILKAITSLSERALRVLAVARRDFAVAPPAADADGIETGLTFLGLAP